MDGVSGAFLTQQELLDSYKLSSHKMKTPCRLRIVCKKWEGFSINKIDP